MMMTSTRRCEASSLSYNRNILLQDVVEGWCIEKEIWFSTSFFYYLIAVSLSVDFYCFTGLIKKTLQDFSHSKDKN